MIGKECEIGRDKLNNILKEQDMLVKRRKKWSKRRMGSHRMAKRQFV